MLRAALSTGGQWKRVGLSTGNKAISGVEISMDSFLPNGDIFSGLSGGSRDPIHDHDMLAPTASQGPGGETHSASVCRALVEEKRWGWLQKVSFSQWGSKSKVSFSAPWSQSYRK